MGPLGGVCGENQHWEREGGTGPWAGATHWGQEEHDSENLRFVPKVPTPRGTAGRSTVGCAWEPAGVAPGWFVSPSHLQAEGVWKVWALRWAQARPPATPQPGSRVSAGQGWGEWGDKQLPSCLLSPTSANWGKEPPTPCLVPSHP